VARQSSLTYKNLGFFALHLAMAGLFLGALLAFRDPEVAVALIVGVSVTYLCIVKRFDYLDPLVGFMIPWIVILLFSVTRLSYFAITIHRPTYYLIVTALCGALFVAGSPKTNIPTLRRWHAPSASTTNPSHVFRSLDIAFISLTLFNVAAAGYVPLLRGLMTGDTGYIDFGIHGVYGFYLASANALAIICLIIFLRTGKRPYLIRYCTIIIILVFLVSRQNIISVGVESLVAYSLVRQRIKWKTLLAGLALGGILFSVMGSFRSGDIRKIAGIDSEYSWVPEPVIWLYAYSYFNIANLDNLVTESDAPYYNASSISVLIPSFIRPGYESYNMGSYILVSNLNVSSYIFPVYQDVGQAGVLVLTVVAMWLTARQYRAARKAYSIGQIGTYSVLYFCASFSFFVNFWFYLPIIFQVVVFAALGNISEVACLSASKKRQPLSLQRTVDSV
jgi:oligosaccharide repeat unit polymerase